MQNAALRVLSYFGNWCFVSHKADKTRCFVSHKATVTQGSTGSVTSGGDADCCRLYLLSERLPGALNS